MTGKKQKKQIRKVIYFDEDAVTDFVQISAGGALSTENSKSEQETSQLSANGSAEVGIIGHFMSLISVKSKLEAKAEGGLEDKTKEMTKSVLINTILTDFISLVNGEEKSAVKHFTGYKISVPKGSFSQMLLITPYLSMVKGGATIPAGDVSIAMEKMDNALRSAKGYYEFVGENQSKQKVIFRFNIKAFRNNYRLIDLLRMDIGIYAIKVGRSTISQLNASKEFDVPLVSKTNPDYDENETSIASDSDNEKPIDVYDVMLAGVEYND